MGYVFVWTIKHYSDARTTRRPTSTQCAGNRPHADWRYPHLAAGHRGAVL